MQMPVVVGILIAIIFLIAFTEWAYHMFQGISELMVDDIYFKYRIFGVTSMSIFLMTATFFMMAFITECPNEVREGVFARLRCEEYMQIKVGTERLFSGKAQAAEPLTPEEEPEIFE